MKNQPKVVCGALIMALASQVSATTTWTFSTDAGATTKTGDATSVTATGSGYANTKDSSATILEVQTSTTLWPGGLGIKNNDYAVDSNETTTPEHSIDNEGRYEMVLMSFTGGQVSLSSLKFGWTGTNDYIDPNGKKGDSDFTVMAYTGAGNPSLGDGTKSWSSLASLSSGWVSIGNFSDAATGVSQTIGSVSNPTIFSSYWLIGAYNPLANPSGGSVTGPTSGAQPYDYLKLKSVTGCVSGSTGCNPPPPPGKVPEPGSLALLGVGLFGLIRMRKAPKA